MWSGTSQDDVHLNARWCSAWWMSWRAPVHYGQWAVTVPTCTTSPVTASHSVLSACATAADTRL